MSDGDHKIRGLRSPSTKGGINHSQENTFDMHVENTDTYIDDMKKGTSNILVSKTIYSQVYITIGRCKNETIMEQRKREG